MPAENANRAFSIFPIAYFNKLSGLAQILPKNCKPAARLGRGDWSDWMSQHTSCRRLVQVNAEYYEFIRCLRNAPEVSHGFIVQTSITPEQQQIYMEKHAKNYYVALENDVPVGFIGVVDRDLRLAVCKHHQHKGIASFMLMEFQKYYQDFDVCIKQDNHASRLFFQKHHFVESGITQRNDTSVIIMKKKK